MKILLLLLCSINTLYTLDQSVNHLHSYLWANYHFFNKDYATAQTQFARLLEDQAPQHIYLGYTHYLFETRQLSAIVDLIPTLDTLYPTHQDMQLLITHTLQLTGQHEQASERYIRLFAQYKNNAEIAYQVASLYIHRKEYDAALSTINTYLNVSPRNPSNFLFYFLTAKIYTALNEHQKALSNIKKSLELQPRFDKGWLIAAALEEEVGALENAIHGYTQFLTLTTGTHADIEQHIAQLTFKQKYIQQTDDHAAHLYTQATQAFEKKEYAQAEQYITEFLQYKPRDTHGRLLSIQILVATHAIDKAAEMTVQEITHDIDNEVWYQTLHMLTHTGLSNKNAIVLLKQHTKSSNALLPALYLADFYLRDHNYTHALTWLDKAAQRTHDAPLKTRISFHQGVVLYQQQEYARAIEILEHSLSLQQEFAPLLNLLAYCYLHTNNLDRALSLVTQALQQDPENPHYIDTKVCILYKQGHHAAARTLAATISPEEQPCCTERMKHVQLLTVQTPDPPGVTHNADDYQHDLSTLH